VLAHLVPRRSHEIRLHALEIGEGQFGANSEDITASFGIFDWIGRRGRTFPGPARLLPVRNGHLA